MFKIIDLDIDETLSANTRVEEVGLVFDPAIETQFKYFSKQNIETPKSQVMDIVMGMFPVKQSFKSYNDYPQAASENACKVLRWIDEHGRDEVAGMEQTGLARANQLCNREPISEETIARMASFERHRKNSEIDPKFEGTPWKDKGYTAWLGWGGDEGIAWAQRKLEQIRKEVELEYEPSLPDYVNYATGKTDGMLVEEFIEKIPYERKDDYIQRCVAWHVKNKGWDDKQSYAVCINQADEAFAEVGERGGIKESRKAPKSGTPNPNPKGEGTAKGDAGTTRGAEVTERVEKILKEKSDDFNERYKDKLGYGVNVGMLKSVYQRGIGAYNVSHSPEVKSGEQWALARVNAFLYLVKEGRPENKKYVGDNDLLPKEHPKYSKDEKFLMGERVSFDYDDTLDTWRGKGLALHEKNTGSILYIISARNDKSGMLRVADELGIPHDRVFATGSNRAKIRKIKELRIQKHYDNNEDVIDQLGSIGIDFTCECLDKFSIVGYIDGEPIFNTIEEAELYGIEEHGCSGHHVHIDENGNEVYMACEIHPEEMSYDFGVDEYTEEEIETVKLLKFLAETNREEFEAVIGAMRGATETELKRRNHKNLTIYFKYERVLSGAPDRDFCTSIEGRYFRRLEIDLLRDVNREFGHQRQPYSKWLYKGGPNCVHAWRRYFVQGENISDQGMVEGTPGTPPKSLPNNGYYSEETKRKSEVAYIISQQNMSKQHFKGENDKRMIYSPLMLPNVLIPRMENGEKYFVRFKPETIEKIQRKFMIEQRLRDTNLEHSNHKFNDIVMVESWIISGEKDKAYELGFTKEEAPIGSWIAGYKVLDTPEGDVIWNDYIKTGKVRGFSVEGEFLLKFSKQQFKNDEQLLNEVINILKEVK